MHLYIRRQWNRVFQLGKFFYCVHFIGLVVKWKVHNGGFISKNLTYIFKNYYIVHFSFYYRPYEVYTVKKNLPQFDFRKLANLFLHKVFSVFVLQLFYEMLFQTPIQLTWWNSDHQDLINSVKTSQNIFSKINEITGKGEIS